MDAVRMRHCCSLSPLVIAFGALTACSTILPVHDYCQIAHPICMQSGEPAKLSDATDRQIDAHNETGAKVCGWKGCKTH